MEWKEVKDGKPVEEGAGDKPELKAEVKAPETETEASANKPAGENTPEVKPEALVEEKPKAPETQKEEKAEAPTDDKAETSAESADNKPAETEEKTPEEKAAEKKTSREKRLKIYSKTVFYILVLGAAAIIIFFLLGVGIKHNDGPVGYWTITEARSGDVVMKAEDAEAMGLREIGAFKLNRGGDCEITYLGKKSTGTWKQSDSGMIVIKYGEDKKIVAKISTKTGVMTAKDDESMVYKLEK